MTASAGDASVTGALSVGCACARVVPRSRRKVGSAATGFMEFPPEPARSGRWEITLLRTEDGLDGQVLADLRSAFFAASRFSAFLVCLSARDGLLALFAAFSFGGLTALGAFGALAGLACFTTFTGLALGSAARERRSTCAAFSALRSSRNACSCSEGDESLPCENARLIIAR